MRLPELTASEMIIYDALYNAAEKGEVCPLNLDLEILIGANSCSMGPKMVRRLEEKGLIRVIRYQKFREVLVVSTGKRTARSPSMHVDRPHVPRGTRTGQQVTSRKLYRQGRL